MELATLSISLLTTGLAAFDHQALEREVATRTLALSPPALTPPRGFSTWNAYPTIGIPEATCYRYLDALVKHGLPSLNYTYFIVDEPCFAGRDPVTGELVENKTTWPNGLKAFGAALRAHGMKLGTYTCVGPTTCGGCVASEGHEEQDVATFAKWGVEYLKVDSCSRNCSASAGIPGGNVTVCGQTLWSRYATAIARHATVTGGQMVFSIDGNLAPGRNGGNPPWKWARGVANSWRTNIDVQNGYSFLHYIIDGQRRLSGNGSWCPSDPADPDGAGFPCADGRTCHADAECPGPGAFAGPGHWNDMDMLIVGTETNLQPPFCPNCTCTGGNCTGCDGCARPMHWTPLTASQSRVQMSLWAALKSPLLASADLTDTAPALVEVLANAEVLAVSDDALGDEARRLGDSAAGRADRSVGEIYAGRMLGGAFAVVMFNRAAAPAGMTLEMADIAAAGASAGAGVGTGAGSARQWTVRDLWAHTDNGTVSATGSVSATVGGNDVVMLVLRPVAAMA
eukprot:g4890.t1